MSTNHQPVAWWRWAVVLAPGLLLYFLPLPSLTSPQSRLLAVFVSTIVALVAQPVRMGVSVVIAMTLLAVTGTLPPAQVLSGFGNLTVWLVFIAFLFSRAVTSTGFGTRLGYLFIRRFARTPLSLGYSLAGADLVLAPFIPSDTARGGGVIFPITRGVAAALGSEPGPTAPLIGSFLTLVCFHTTYVASAMFLTGMAANPLIAEFARQIGHVELNWGRWLAGSIVPGFISLAVVPWFLHRAVRPELRDTAPARQMAHAHLESIGPLRREEKWLVAIFLGIMAGWVTSPWHGISNTFVAMAGLAALLLARVITWDDLLSEKRAWDALIWFAPLVMMSDALNQSGVVKILSGRLFGLMIGWPWLLVWFALALVYLYVHYGFASMTGQVTALYPGFLTAALAAGVPPMLAALPLAYFSSINAAMTHYGTGSAPVFFGAGYVRQTDWWRLGFQISLINLVIWLGIGVCWWKLIGLW
ncbi:MAG: DASS family sodium-coupled anion symporter [Bryobacteraceae bacterium]